MRNIWTGKDEKRRQAAIAERSNKDAAKTTTRSFERAIIAGPRAHERSGRGRVVGIDAARGFALIGMFAVHLLPAYNEEADRATFAWLFFAGNASALFAVLSGIALAFITGGRTPYTGERMLRAKVQIAARALFLCALGAVINALDLPVYNILVYLALMFALAIPLVNVPRVVLLIIGAAMLVLMPVLRYLLHLGVEFAGYHPNPTFVDLFTDPLGVLATLSITGAYPALTWWAFLCVGLGIGRFGMQRTGSRLGLIVTGLLAYGLTVATSFVLISRLGGYELIASALPGASEDDIDEFIVFGPDGPLPTDGPGWLIVNAPHSNTTFALISGLAFSVTAIGVFILLSRKWTALLKPFIDAGSMPTTLYVGHLLFVTFMPEEWSAESLFVIQVLGAILFAMLWKGAMKNGPIEWVMTTTVRAVGRALVPLREPDSPTR